MLKLVLANNSLPKVHVLAATVKDRALSYCSISNKCSFTRLNVFMTQFMCPHLLKSLLQVVKKFYDPYFTSLLNWSSSFPANLTENTLGGFTVFQPTKFTFPFIVVMALAGHRMRFSSTLLGLRGTRASMWPFRTWSYFTIRFGRTTFGACGSTKVLANIHQTRKS